MQAASCGSLNAPSTFRHTSLQTTTYKSCPLLLHTVFDMACNGTMTPMLSLQASGYKGQGECFINGYPGSKTDQEGGYPPENTCLAG